MVPHRLFPCQRRALPHSRRSCDSDSQRARTTSPAHRLELAGLRPRTPSTGSIPASRLEVATCSLSVIFNSQATVAPFHALSPPARHGDGPPHRATLPRTFRAEARSAHRREDPSYQYLQPTCCHEHQLNPPILKHEAYALPTHASTTALRPARSCRRQNETSTKAPSSRERHLRPRVTTWLAPRSPAVACGHSFPLGAASVRSGTSARLFRPRGRSNDHATDASCHAFDPPGLRRAGRRRQGPTPRTMHQPPWLLRPEATSADGSPAPPLRLR